ncbi:MAG TPA: DUF1003 domain-containing protein [Actinocrinis sp.]|nr:DUF1003 domain-containing protein [Actinocrinis sp.]
MNPTDEKTGRRITATAGTAARRITGGWRHPGVRSSEQLTRGERAADKMRNGMGSWGFVFGALVFLGLWMAVNATISLSGHKAFDGYPFILLNLVLSCVAALQGAILLIAAKRSDQVSSELAQHDYEADVASHELLKSLNMNFTALAVEHAAMNTQQCEMQVELSRVLALLTEAGKAA